MEQEILEIFKYLGFTPRPNQINTVKQILNAFYAKKKSYVCLSAPTGSGKSLIAEVVAEYVGRRETCSEAVSEVLIHTKTLQNQYENTFGDKILNVKGASNYPCSLLQSTAEDCILKLHGGKKGTIPEKCKGCQFISNRQSLNTTRHIVTNYTYYFISMMCTHIIAPRTITIFDESHLINDIYCGHTSIDISSKILKAIHKALLMIGEDKSASIINSLLTQDLPRLNDKNFHEFVKKTESELDNIVNHCLRSKAADHYKNKDMDLYKKYNQSANRLGNMLFRISDYGVRDFESVVEVIDGESVKIQPVFIGKAFNNILKNSKYNIFMSATNNPDFVSLTLDIPKKDIEFIVVPPSFPKENKKVVFFNHASYNYNNMNNIDFLKDVGDIVLNIITDDEHMRQKGVILTPNFKINEFLSNILNDKFSYKGMIKVFSQKEGEQLDSILQNFMGYNKPSILLSPSIWEGISLDGDISEYQIMIKAPYGFLGDKRVKYIFDNYKTIYSIQTLFKIIQGMGRSTRSKDDKSVTYCLDTNLNSMFSNSNNVWKDEFDYESL